uniref:Uncharacterized protein n=1 Tax=Daphnia magna TaxID=35525 RepID=A0A0N8ENI9_9CRUS
MFHFCYFNLRLPTMCGTVDSFYPFINIISKVYLFPLKMAKTKKQ